MRGLPPPPPRVPQGKNRNRSKATDTFRIHREPCQGEGKATSEGEGSDQVCRLNVPTSLATLQACPGPISEKQNGERK